MINTLVLAYIGDAVYEVYVRQHLIKQKINNVNECMKKSLDYVSAKSQRKHIERLINDNFLTDEEIDIYKRGRNAKSNSKSKNSDVITYRIATGLECLIGWLYENNKINRIEQIMTFILE